MLKRARLSKGMEAGLLSGGLTSAALLLVFTDWLSWDAGHGRARAMRA
jgi:hypothetical protein